MADITNKLLGGFISTEFIVIAIIGGIAWGELTSDVNALEVSFDKQLVQHSRDIESVVNQEEKVGKEITDIKLNIREIQTKQEAIEDSLKEQEKDIKQILKILKD